MREIKQFERTAKDDFQRLWDNVNELQEITNVTTKNIEEIYDKGRILLIAMKSESNTAQNAISDYRIRARSHSKTKYVC